MAGLSRLGAKAILALAIAAIGVRIAALSAHAPVQQPVPRQLPIPRPIRIAPITVDAARISRFPAPAGVQKRQAPDCIVLDPRLRGGTGCAATTTTAHTPPITTTPSPTVIRRVLDTHGPIRFGTWFWDEAGVPAGPIVITVDTKASVLSIFRAGYEIGTTAVIYGDDGMPTPLGVFPITQKDAHHVSNLYHAPMPYMQRLTNDGVSIHGSPIAADYATHGCIGVPVDFARKLFGATRIGDRVIVTRGETLSAGEPIKAI